MCCQHAIVFGELRLCVRVWFICLQRNLTTPFCLFPASKEAVLKVESWGSRLREAMQNYIRKSDEAREVYHGKSRSARMAQKIQEEAERQAQIGGITRAALLPESRLQKLREATARAREEELQSSLAYRSALDVVSRKQNELYTVRLPRVMEELQRLVEEVM